MQRRQEGLMGLAQPGKLPATRAKTPEPRKRGQTFPVP